MRMRPFVQRWDHINIRTTSLHTITVQNPPVLVSDTLRGKIRAPNFEVSVEGTVVFSYRLPRVDSLTCDVTAMMALKDSFHIPDRMGWNGGPCAPTSLDAWEGVICRPNKDRSAFVIFQIEERIS